MKVLVSACLLGENCKYSGGNNLDPRVAEWLRETGCEAVPVCPEVLGGLPVPRTPAEIAGGAATARDGQNVDAGFAGARPWPWKLPGGRARPWPSSSPGAPAAA